MTKTMKRVMVALAVVLAIAMAAASVPLVNNIAVAVTLKKLQSVTPMPLYPVTESISEVGRFIGNGNGAQYLAAIVVQTEASEAEIRAYYEPIGYSVVRQESSPITVLEHHAPTLESTLSPEKTYYLVYTVKAGVPPFAWLDIRGC